MNKNDVIKFGLLILIVLISTTSKAETQQTSYANNFNTNGNFQSHSIDPLNWTSYTSVPWSNVTVTGSGSGVMTSDRILEINTTAGLSYGDVADHNKKITSAETQGIINFTNNATSSDNLKLNWTMYWVGQGTFDMTTLVWAGASLVVDFNTSKYIQYTVNGIGVPEANKTNYCMIEVNTTPMNRQTYSNFSRNINNDYTLCEFTGAWQITNISAQPMMITKTLTGVNVLMFMRLDDVLLYKDVSNALILNMSNSSNFITYIETQNNASQSAFNLTLTNETFYINIPLNSTINNFSFLYSGQERYSGAYDTQFDTSGQFGMDGNNSHLIVGKTSTIYIYTTDGAFQYSFGLTNLTISAECLGWNSSYLIVGGSLTNRIIQVFDMIGTDYPEYTIETDSTNPWTALGCDFNTSHIIASTAGSVPTLMTSLTKYNFFTKQLISRDNLPLLFGNQYGQALTWDQNQGWNWINYHASSPLAILRYNEIGNYTNFYINTTCRNEGIHENDTFIWGLCNNGTILRYIYSPSFPNDTYVDFENDGTLEFQYQQPFNSTNGTSITITNAKVQTALQRCTNVVNNSCAIPIASSMNKILSNSSVPYRMVNNINVSYTFNISLLFTRKEIFQSTSSLNITVDQNFTSQTFFLNNTNYKAPVDINISGFYIEKWNGTNALPVCLLNDNENASTGLASSPNCVSSFLIPKGSLFPNTSFVWRKLMAQEVSLSCDLGFGNFGNYCKKIEGADVLVYGRVNVSDNQTKYYPIIYNVSTSRLDGWDDRTTVIFKINGTSANVSLVTTDATNVQFLVGVNYSNSESLMEGLWEFNLTYRTGGSGGGGDPGSGGGGGSTPSGEGITIDNVTIEPVIFKLITSPGQTVKGTLRVTNNGTQSITPEIDCKEIEPIAKLCPNVEIFNIASVQPNTREEIEFAYTPQKDIDTGTFGKDYRFNLLFKFNANEQIIAINVNVSPFLGPIGSFVGFISGSTYGIPNFLLLLLGLMIVTILIFGIIGAVL